MNQAEKTRAIVLRAIRYGDNSLIVKLLTERHGLKSFMIKGAFNKNAKIRAALFQPLTLLEVVSMISRGEIGYLKEACLEYAYQDIPININKNTIVIFLCELLSKTIQESDTDIELFGFIHHAMTHLDEMSDNYSDFPLRFSIELCRLLGFAPNTASFRQDYIFDLEEGRFRHDSTGCTYFINSQLSGLFYQLCCKSLFDDMCMNIQNNERRQLLDCVISYYKLHVSGFNEMKSTDILKAVLHQ